MVILIVMQEISQNAFYFSPSAFNTFLNTALSDICAMRQESYNPP